MVLGSRRNKQSSPQQSGRGGFYAIWRQWPAASGFPDGLSSTPPRSTPCKRTQTQRRQRPWGHHNLYIIHLSCPTAKAFRIGFIIISSHARHGLKYRAVQQAKKVTYLTKHPVLKGYGWIHVHPAIEQQLKNCGFKSRIGVQILYLLVLQTTQYCNNTYRTLRSNKLLCSFECLFVNLCFLKCSLCHRRSL